VGWRALERGTLPALVGRMAATHEPLKVGDLLKHVGDDLRTIATSELELTRNKMTEYLDRTLMRVSVIIIGAFIALIGLAMLCVVAVLAMQPLIALLWVRLLMMSGVYILVGGGAAWLYAHNAAKGPDIQHEVDEVGQTFDAITKGLKQ
jgi:hypothetical protein